MAKRKQAAAENRASNSIKKYFKSLAERNFNEENIPPNDSNVEDERNLASTSGVNQLCESASNGSCKNASCQKIVSNGDSSAFSYYFNQKVTESNSNLKCIIQADDLKELRLKHATTKSAYTSMLQISAQKDIEINKLRLQLEQVNQKERSEFTLDEFAQYFTEEQLRKLQCISPNARQDTEFVREILNMLYLGSAQIPTLIGDSKMDPKIKSLIFSMLENRIQYFVADNDEYIQRIKKTRLGHIISDCLFKMRRNVVDDNNGDENEMVVFPIEETF